MNSSVPCLLQALNQADGSAEVVQTSGVLPTMPGTLAIELPAGEAFELALSASEKLGRPLVLIDPSTRVIKGTARK